MPEPYRYWEEPYFGGRGEVAVRCRFCHTYLASWGVDGPMTWRDGDLRRKVEFNLQVHFLGCAATPMPLRHEAVAFMQKLYPDAPAQWALRSVDEVASEGA